MKMRTALILALLLIALGTAVGQPGKCDQTPVGAKILTPSDDSEQLFQIRIDSAGRKFLAEQTYVLILEATNDSRPFKEFMVTVEEPEVDDSPYEYEHTHDVGTLMTLAEDTRSRYSERCFNSIENTDNSDKDRIEAHWIAPKESASNQRIRFRAMVAENKEKWYSGDQLTIIVEKDTATSLDAPPLPPAAVCDLCSEARFEVIFKGKWSRLTHPNKYPSKPDTNGYTHMVGASHSFDYTLWETGMEAKSWLRALVEDAETEPMEREIIGNMSESGGTRTLIRGKRRHHPYMSEPSHALFRVDRIHHLFSLVVGMRPSPDWFLGTRKFELCTDHGWLAYANIPLYPYDLGTMDGISYDSPRSMTRPGDKIDRVAVGSFNKESPFYQMNLHDMAPFAYLEVQRLAVYPMNDEDCKAQDEGIGTLEAVEENDKQKQEDNNWTGGYGSKDQPEVAESRSRLAECEGLWQWSACTPLNDPCGPGTQSKQWYRGSEDNLDNDRRVKLVECQKYESILETRLCSVPC